MILLLVRVITLDWCLMVQRSTLPRRFERASYTNGPILINFDPADFPTVATGGFKPSCLKITS